jgi:hypothetical protein
MKQKELYLIGDGILDNFLWSEKKQDLKFLLSEKKINVFNYAVDGATLENFFSGYKPNSKSLEERNYPYNLNSKKVQNCSELLLLDSNIESFYDLNRKDIFYVLSLGGEDIKSKYLNFIFGVEKFIKSIFTKTFFDSYSKVLEKLINKNQKIILVSIYIPYSEKGSLYEKYSHIGDKLLKKWMKFLCLLGKKYNLPVIDLGNSIDRKDQSYYVKNVPDRLSLKSYHILSDLIEYITNHYHGFNVYLSKNNKIIKKY